ncbi:acetyl-CoA carboxylase biotin carboxyl carrier protein [Geodermatophilus sp. CPCC 206100]|uniref:acetyl-CoA carboxylase biotin carboxyl carrier protein n=1 Tax=Geodermatophilus sp. CPCC 206100 TaxID=3020054 RepID=UPI003AFFDF74
MAPGERAPISPVAVPGEATTDLRDEVVALAHALPGGLRRLVVRNGDRAVEVEWATETLPGAAPAGPSDRDRPGVPGPADPVPAGPADPAQLPEGTTAVRAPLVGTFYAAPSPGAAPFVGVGDEVEQGQTLGIVEAMKLMNPIVADEAGVVAEILVGDAESVEYDQILMHLRPAGSATGGRA